MSAEPPPLQRVFRAEVVRVEPRTGLYYVLAGRRPPSPTDLLGGLRMQRLLQQLPRGMTASTARSAPRLRPVARARANVAAADGLRGGSNSRASPTASVPPRSTVA